MPSYPLFTRDELATAFALVFPAPAVAERVAGQWFEQFTDDVDHEGRFVYHDWHEETGEPDVVATGPAWTDTSKEHEAEAAWYRGWSDEQKAEFLLRFSDFHLALAALVSPQLFERMRAARGMTRAQAERSGAQMTRIARALRG